MMAADTLIRKKVYRLQSEQRETYGSFQAALLEVIENHKYLWNDARTKASLAKLDRKEPVQAPEPDQVQEEAPNKPSTPNKNRKRRARNKELLKEAKQLKKAHSSEVKATPKVERDKRIPEAEWKSISSAASTVTGEKRCHFYNSSMGCAMGDKCRFKHSCMKCGAQHPMVGNH